MKTCANCGHTMEDQDVFCGNCGAMSLDGTDQTAQQAAPAAEPEAVPVPEAEPAPAPEPAPKPAGSKGLWKIGVLAAAAVVVLVVAVLGITGALKNGDKSFADVQTEFLLDTGIQYAGQWVEQYEALTDLSTDLTMTVETGIPAVDTYLTDSALRMGVEVQRDALALDATLQVMGSDVFSGEVVLEDGMLAIALPEVTDNYYVLDLKQMIYEATGVEVTELALPELSMDTITSLMKNYFNIVIGAANDDNVTVEKDSAIELPWLGETVNGTLYTFRPTAADVEGMLLRLADALENDEDLREFITSLTGGQLLTAQLAETGADWQQELDEAAAMLREQAADVGQMVADSGFTWTVGYADGRVVYQQLITADEAGLTYESLGEEKTGRHDVVYVQESADSYLMMVEGNYTKKDGKYSGNVYMTQQDNTTMDMTFQDVTEKERSALGSAYGIYSFTVEQYGTTVTWDMAVVENENGGTDHRIVMSMPEMADAFGTDQVTINLHSSDEEATIRPIEGQPVDVATLDDSDLEELSMLIQQYLMQTLLPLGIGA